MELSEIKGDLIYENKFEKEDDIKDFVLEGKAVISFETGVMRMENALSKDEGQKANYVLWCPIEFPSEVLITWDFKPVKEPGLAILFFAAKGCNGEDLFDPSLSERTGEYPLYHHGDINAFHVSYFRRKEADERAFHTCNLRKSYGFYLVTQGADPIPDASEDNEFYHMSILKKKDEVSFFINDLKIFSFSDSDPRYGEPLKGGKIGFRQLAPMIGEYKDLAVYKV